MPSVVAQRVVRLQVGRARPHDLGGGRARIPPRVFTELGIAEGDVIEIAGKRRTAAIALRLGYEDRNLDLLRIDGVQRANAGVSIGEHIEIHVAHSSPARRLELTPVQDTLLPPGSEPAVLAALVGRPAQAGDLVTVSPRMGSGPTGPLGIQEIRLAVVATEPRGIVRVESDTALQILAPVQADQSRRRAEVTYDDLGGLDDAVAHLREMTQLPLRHPDLFTRLGIDPPRGILLHGPPGTGKTLLARAVANEEDARFFYIGGPEIMAPHQGESEKRLRDVFERAMRDAPSIIFMDDIDAIAPRREETSGETERRIVTQLLTLLDGLEPRGQVVVIGATNRLDAIDEALRRPGRFDRELAVGVPDAEGRRQILAIHTRGMPLGKDVDLDALARSQHGFVGADLAALVREAALAAVRRHLAGVDLDVATDSSVALQGLFVTSADFDVARQRVRPSAMREILVQIPDTRWTDVGGLEAVKDVLRRGIELPLRDPSAFTRLGIRPAKGFLLFGPPGTGKTLIGRAVAGETEANFISAKASDLLSKWYGDSERQIARLFARARQVAPSILFLDEIDALAPQRGLTAGDHGASDRVVNTLLAEMDGLESLERVVVIGATNRPALIDPALLRPGRFDEIVYVPPPDEAGRLHILRLQAANVPLADDVDLSWLAAQTPGLTGADLEGIIRRAALSSYADDPLATRVGMSALRAALSATWASVTAEMEREYETMLEELRRESPRGRRSIGFESGAGRSPDPTE
jgi:transitional endoplasmic reticulum ATPase